MIPDNKIPHWSNTIVYADGDLVIHEGIIKRVCVPTAKFSINNPLELVDATTSLIKTACPKPQSTL